MRIVAAILAAALLAGCGAKQEGVKALSVKGIRTSPDAYRGKVSIAGVVAVRSTKDPGMFAIVDPDDVRAGVPTGRQIFLPVHYDGGAPSVGMPVVVTGTFSEKDPVFHASAVKPAKG